MRQPSKYVYVAQVGEWAKVGITSDTVARGKRIACETGLPVEMVKRWRVSANARHVEAICIYGLRKKLAPLGRECFAITAAELIEAVEDAIARVRAGERNFIPRERNRLRYHERKCQLILAQLEQK